jgi:hypothetical protein
VAFPAVAASPGGEPPTNTYGTIGNVGGSAGGSGGQYATGSLGDRQSVNGGGSGNQYASGSLGDRQSVSGGGGDLGDRQSVSGAGSGNQYGSGTLGDRQSVSGGAGGNQYGSGTLAAGRLSVGSAVSGAASEYTEIVIGGTDASNYATGELGDRARVGTFDTMYEGIGPAGSDGGD